MPLSSKVCQAELVEAGLQDEHAFDKLRLTAHLILHHPKYSTIKKGTGFSQPVPFISRIISFEPYQQPGNFYRC